MQEVQSTPQRGMNCTEPYLTGDSDPAYSPAISSKVSKSFITQKLRSVKS